MGCHPHREYAEKCLPRHVSHLLPSRTRAITALSSVSFQTKGGEEFSRRDSIQKKPQALRISLRQNRAFNLNTKTQSVKLHEQSRMLSMALSALTQPSCHQLPSHPIVQVI
jgi:hypothetical protein